MTVTKVVTTFERLKKATVKTILHSQRLSACTMEVCTSGFGSQIHKTRAMFHGLDPNPRVQNLWETFSFPLTLNGCPPLMHVHAPEFVTLNTKAHKTRDSTTLAHELILGHNYLYASLPWLQIAQYLERKFIQVSDFVCRF